LIMVVKLTHAVFNLYRITRNAIASLDRHFSLRTNAHPAAPNTQNVSYRYDVHLDQ